MLQGRDGNGLLLPDFPEDLCTNLNYAAHACALAIDNRRWTNHRG